MYLIESAAKRVTGNGEVERSRMTRRKGLPDAGFKLGPLSVRTAASKEIQTRTALTLSI